MQISADISKTNLEIYLALRSANSLKVLAAAKTSQHIHFFKVVCAKSKLQEGIFVGFDVPQCVEAIKLAVIECI